jgi:hypothetical protein
LRTRHTFSQHQHSSSITRLKIIFPIRCQGFTTRAVWITLMGLDAETNRSPLLTLQLELDEGRLCAEIESVVLNVTSGDGDGLDGLIYSLRTDGLDLDFAFASQQRRDCTRYGVGAGISRYT